MNILTFPGGGHADALPGGEFVVTYYDGRRHMDTHVRRVTYADPVSHPLHPPLPTPKGLPLHGQDHDNPHITPEWTQAEAPPWHLWPETPHGVSPVIYDANGLLHISNGSIGSQGWRYVEQGTGRLVTGDESHEPRPPCYVFDWT